MKTYSFRLVSMRAFCFCGCIALVFIFCLSGQAVAAGAQTLPQLVAGALSQHPAIRSQSELQQAAQAQIASAKWQYWPTPSVSAERASASSSDPSYRGDKQVVTVGVRQPLWTGGRLTANLGRAEARAELARSDLEGARQQLALRVIQGWSDVITAQAGLIAYEHSRAEHERLLGMVLRRAQEGVSSQGDVVLARSRLEAVVANIVSSTARRDVALQRLRYLVGDVVEGVDFQGMAVPFDFARAPADLMEAAKELSPQLSKARAQARVAERDVDLARAALMPEVSLRLERQFGNFSQRGGGDNRIFISVGTSLGGGLSNISAIDGAQSQYSAALTDVDTQLLLMQEQVSSDLTLVQTSVSRRASLEISRRLTAEVSQSSERLFLAGRKQWLDLMNAAREQAQTEVQLADVLGAEQLAGWRLKLYTEGVDALLQP